MNAYPEIIARARQAPQDAELAVALPDDCRGAGLAAADTLACLQLKYLNVSQRWPVLNQLGEHFLEIGKKRLAYVCYSNSLGIRPSQPEIKARALALEPASHSPRLAAPRADRHAVSVIMPTYNRADELACAIRSVLDQSLEDFELIVINDGGADVADLIHSFGSGRIRYLNQPRNLGHAAAINAGLEQATGRYIAYLDDDDIYYPEHLKLLADFLDAHPEVDGVYSNAWYSHGEMVDGRFVEASRELNAARPARYDRAALRRGNFIASLNVMYRRRCLEKAGLFNEDLPRVRDWEHLVRLSDHCRFHQLDDITGEYRWKRNNLSRDRLMSLFYTCLLQEHFRNPYRHILRLRAASGPGGEEAMADALAELDAAAFSEPGPVALELLALAAMTGHPGFAPLVRRHAGAAFVHDPATCLRRLAGLGAWGALLPLLPRLPGRLWHSLLARASR